MLRALAARKLLHMLDPVRRTAAQIAAIRSSRSDKFLGNSRVAGQTGLLQLLLLLTQHLLAVAANLRL